MLKETIPIPQNEMKRLLSLAELDIDYSELSDSLKDLTLLAAKVSGAEISLINLIDAYTTWTVSGYGLEIQQTAREESTCQYTIMGDRQFEVPDFSLDERFMHKDFLKPPLSLRYYFGVPLTDHNGNQIGALCVLDKRSRSLEPEKREMMKIIADQVMNRIWSYSTIRSLQAKVKIAEDTKNKVAHDIRGPIGGIIGLSNLIAEQDHNNNLKEILEFIQMIQKSSKSLLELADEILTEDQQNKRPEEHQTNLEVFKHKLEDLYNAQAKNKDISLQITLSEGNEHSPFPKNKLLQIAGNLISNAIKFTPQGGTVKVELALAENEQQQQFSLKVFDSGKGLSEQVLQNLEKGNSSSTDGTYGEKGYGFGLALVKHLISGLNGTMKVKNLSGSGACFEVELLFEAAG